MYTTLNDLLILASVGMFGKIAIWTFAIILCIPAMILVWVIHPYTVAPITSLISSPVQLLFSRFTTAMLGPLCLLLLAHYMTNDELQQDTRKIEDSSTNPPTYER